MSTKRPLLVYTDGGCDKNPGGNGAFAAIIFENTKPTFLSGFEPKTTNQRMELMAVIKALDYINTSQYIKVYSDSAYVCNCFINEWYVNWIKNKWINSNGKPVANRDLWEQLLTLVNFHKSVEFTHVKGHSTNIFNNKCDEMATDAIKFTKMIHEMIDNKLI